MFRTLCLSALLLLAAASVARAQDSLMVGQYVRVYQKQFPAVEGTLVSLTPRALLVATSPSDTVRIARVRVRSADVYQAIEPSALVDVPGGSAPAEERGVWVPVKRVRSGPAPSLGMHIMF